MCIEKQNVFSVRETLMQTHNTEQLLTYCLLRSQDNSASYPQWVAEELRGEGLVWLLIVVVCLLVAPRVQLFADAGNGLLHSALRYHWLMPISCHFRDCKVLLTHANSAVSSTRPLPLLIPSAQQIGILSEGILSRGGRCFRDCLTMLACDIFIS